jgi:cytochrome c oxidase subunit 2
MSARTPPARSLALSAVLAVLALARQGLPAAARAEEPPPAAGPGAGPRVVEIVARRFQFTPAEVTLRRGEPVLLRLRSEDVTHGFFTRALGLDATNSPGAPLELPLTPRAAGRYAVICDHFCGAGHGNMKMTIVVVDGPP